MPQMEERSIAPAIALPLALPATEKVDDHREQERYDQSAGQGRSHLEHGNPDRQHKDDDCRDGVHDRPFKIKFVADDTAMALAEAIENAPFSFALRSALLEEIRGLPSSLTGALDCKDVAATVTGDWRVRIGCGSAGELLTAALRALTLAVENENHEFRSLPGVATAG